MGSELDAEDRLAFTACLAHVLGDLGSPPPRPGPAADPLPVWRAWLAERGLAMVDVDAPGSFAMPGYWIALLRPPGEDPRPVVMFGVPSGPVFDPRGVELPVGDVERGWVLAPLDLRDGATARGPERAAPAGGAELEAILIAEDREGPMTEIGTATISAAGIAGDRYARGQGTFTNSASNGHAVTLIAAEALEDTRLPDGSLSSAAEMRRNLVTRGVDPNDLVGRRFKIGEVELIGRRPCEPCAHLQRLTRQGILRAFIHRGGLRADVISPGTIAVGDRVIATADQPSA